MLTKTDSLKGLTYYERAKNRWILVSLWDHLSSENKQRSLCGAWVYDCLARKANLVYYFQVYLFMIVKSAANCYYLLCVFYLFSYLQFIISYLAQKQASKLINCITSANLESKQSGKGETIHKHGISQKVLM